MAAKKRQCSNCRFFRDAEMAGSGWCTHPKRQHTSDVRILIRGAELACRNSWGGDLFQDAQESGSSADADLPGSTETPHDDEVTSVITPPERAPAPPEPEDRVVSDTPSPARDETAHDKPRNRSNDAARFEQDERARIMARGSHDAVKGARERLIHRRSRSAGAVPADLPEGPSGDAGSDNRAMTRQERYFDRTRHHDATDNGPVPRAEIERNRQGSALAPDRFDSVPERDPAFELRGWHRQSRYEAESGMDDQHGSAGSDGEPPGDLSSYEHALRRARQVRETRQGHTPHVYRARPTASGTHDASGNDRHAGSAVTPPEDDADGNATGSDDEPAEPSIREANGYDDHDPPPAGDRDTGGPMQSRARRPRAGSWLSQLGIRRAPRQPGDTPAASGADDEPYAVAAGWSAAPADEALASDSDLGYAGQRAPEPDDSDDYRDEPHPWQEPARHSPRHRARTGQALPDLDDNLFSETFARPRTDITAERYERIDRAHRDVQPPSPSAAAASNEDDPAAPQNSFFRARRFQNREPRPQQAPPPEDNANDGVDDSDAAVLPDLDAGELDLKELVARGGELLDMRIEIAPEVPRACRTCRYFRSTDGGARGWCTNEWAFTHRRMVNEDDLPCETTIGCWWLPADRYWMIGDHHGYAAPTPRMDVLIASHGEQPARKASGS